MSAAAGTTILSSVEHSCQDWEAVRTTIENFVGPKPFGWLFRGHRIASWALQPSIERLSGGSLLKSELQFYSDFKSKAHLYSDRLPLDNDAVSWLSFMQHHRVPTRLLDWTYSPYVALYFAIEQEIECETEDCSAVWAVDFDRLDRTARLKAGELFNVPYHVRFEDSERFRRIAFPVTIDDGDQYVNTWIETEYSQTGLVIPLLPMFHNNRLSAQQGLFLLNCNYQIDFETSLSHMMKDQLPGWIHRITFPKTIRKQLLQYLFQYNVHPASLFPDIDGLARFITAKAALTSV